METRSLSFFVSPAIGDVSAELIAPDSPTCILTLAHGAGAGMNHEFMLTISKALADKGIATLRFNFPFMEKQKRRPDAPAVAQKTIEEAIAKAHELFPSLPVFAAGKSFGGRMSSQFLAMNPATGVKGIIFFGFPLHQPGKPSIERAEHLQNIKVPMLFLQGTKDQLASFELIEKVCVSLPSATLLPIVGANHAFKAGKKDLIPILTESTRSWIDQQSDN